MPLPRSSDVALPSFYSPRPAATHGAETPTDLSLTGAPAPGATITPSESDPQQDHQSQDQVQQQLLQSTMPPPPLLLSPSFTPPQTPGTATPSHPHASVTSSAPRSVPVDSLDPNGGCGNKKPRLMERLPTVTCQVRARIPTTTGTEMFLYLYENDVDDKEHLAIVFGNGIRSESLDRVREGETEMARMIRGAYTGRLFPGRTSSGMANGKMEQQGEVKVTKGEEKENQRVDNRPRYKADGTPDRSHIPLVRIHSECYTGETAWSARCDCGEQLDEAARLMSQSPSGGIIIYLRQEGRGIGLGEKLKAYNLQDLGNDTVEANLILRHPADKRSYGLATSMLRDLGCREVRLLTNNPEKVRAVEGPGREVVVRERVAMVPLAWRGNQKGVKGKEVEEYLKTKIEKMGHMLSLGP